MEWYFLKWWDIIKRYFLKWNGISQNGNVYKKENAQFLKRKMHKKGRKKEMCILS